MFFFRKNSIPLTEFFPEGFVDIHSHLLPGIDDGAKDIDNSIDLIKRMNSYGINKIITTPHVLGDVYPNSSETIKQKLKEVRIELKKRNVEVSINAAAEYMIDERFQELLSKGDVLTLKGNYILVEMPYFTAPFNLFDVLFEIHLKGFKPILAHPERYIYYHQKIDSYYKLKKAGCLFQINLLSLTGQYGKDVKKITQKLLKENLYDFVGTDVHHKNHLKLLEKISNSKVRLRLKNLLENNRKVFG